MANTDHAGFKKIQCWIPESLWDKIEALDFPNQTSAVTEAFKVLLNISLNNPNSSQEIPRLTATIEGLQMLLQEKDARISDLKREAETLGIFAHYFKSLEHRRLETSTEDREMRGQGREEEPAREDREDREGREIAPQEHRDKPDRKHREKRTKEERKIVQEPGEKPASSLGEAQGVKKEGARIKKTCKNCGAEFEASNPKQETCSDKCRSAFSRKNRKK